MRPAPADGPRAASAGTEVAFAGGFRRTSGAPAAGAAARLRARLVEAALGQPQAVVDGLQALWSWENVSALAASGWFADALRDTAASRRALRRRLRLLGARPTRLGGLSALPPGTAVRVIGRALAAPGIGRGSSGRSSHIWFKSEMTADNVRLLAEVGHDFFLTDEAGQTVRVLVAGGALLGAAAATLDHDDPVQVFGALDHVIDPQAPAGSRHPRAEPLALALRSGDQLPLIVLAGAAGNHWSHTLR
jgi:hypothetical protein